MKKKFFTVYWLDGSKNIISGETFEDATVAAGYGGAVKAIDWYDNGVTNTHYYVKGNGWVKKVPYLLADNSISDFSVEDLEQLLNKHAQIVVVFNNKDQLTIQHIITRWCSYGWVETIYICYSSNHNGEYGGKIFSTGGQHWKPEDIGEAIMAFKTRIRSDKPWLLVPGSVTLNEIAESQPQYR